MSSLIMEFIVGQKKATTEFQLWLKNKIVEAFF